ncbi:MAG: sugar ABC transporter substrate-binding protein [Chloroflexi bacterium]|nr:sugar ABC transporter substrate-binding protein [Chloroflexota bacterium]
MKTKSIFFLFVMTAIILSACRPANGKISFMVFGDPAELAAYQNLVDSFSQAHPEIQVEIIQIPGQADYRKRLAADLTAGDPADVLLINYRRFAGFANIGALEPLGAYLEKSNLIKEADFYPEAINAFKWHGELTCIPQNISSLVVYFNKDLFDSAGVPYPADGWTWDDFLSAAQALTKDVDRDGVTDQFGAGIEPSLIRLAPFIWQVNGVVVDDDANPTTLTLDLSEDLQAAEFFVSLQTIHRVVPNAEEESSEDSESRFINGRLAMFFNSRRGVPTYRESADFDWDVAALPQKDVPASILHADAYCLPSASKNKPAAWTFIEYANSVEGQTIIAGTGRTVPSLISVANSPAFLDPNAKPANSRVFLDTIPFIRALPIHPNWAEVEETASEEIMRAFYGEASVNDAMLRAVQLSQEIFFEK